jgi:hypothetical protein
MVARAVIALAVPLAVAYALGDIRIGALISTGALPAVLSESAGPYRYRARRLGTIRTVRGRETPSNSRRSSIHEGAGPVKGLLLLFFLGFPACFGQARVLSGGSRLAGSHPPEVAWL